MTAQVHFVDAPFENDPHLNAAEPLRMDPNTTLNPGNRSPITPAFMTYQTKDPSTLSIHPWDSGPW